MASPLHRDLSSDIQAIREEIASEVEHADQLRKRFKTLLLRVDLLAKEHGEVLAENSRLRAENDRLLEEIRRLKSEYGVAG